MRFCSWALTRSGEITGSTPPPPQPRLGLVCIVCSILWWFIALSHWFASNFPCCVFLPRYPICREGGGLFKHIQENRWILLETVEKSVDFFLLIGVKYFPPLDNIHAFFYNNSSVLCVCPYTHLRSAFCETPPPMKGSRPSARAVWETLAAKGEDGTSRRLRSRYRKYW